jgi:UDP-N-acetylglucosamine--dolichyl-phosphate N-acetylglucosaminephosphotransferase
MIDYILIIPLVASFLITLFLMPFWIRKAETIGLMWEDMNKLNSPKVAGSGGIIVVVGFTLSILLFIAYRVIILQTSLYLIEILALLTVILIVGGIGLIDDLLGWWHGGLSRKSRIIILIFAAIPLMVINAGKSTIGLPFDGLFDLGILYPLIIIPIGVVGATSTFNFLAGFNGLEAGNGIIILSAMAFVSYFMGNSWLSVICLAMIFALLAFLIFNWSPANVFPGDCLTYPVGALIASIAILGNFEKVAAFFFLPFVLEVILKSRGKLVKSSFGKPNSDGTLELKHDKIYGNTHLAIFILQKLGIKPTEKKVVLSIWIFELVIIMIGILIFRQGIFLR